MLQELRNKRMQYINKHGDGDIELHRQRYFKALQNARLAVNGERYFRTMYDSSNESWNQRDHTMFETLRSVMAFHGKSSKAIVWAHNTHIGDARATERSEHNEFNLGQLVRETFADSAYLIGFGTDHGTVAAASKWGGPMQVMQIPPSSRDSYGYLFHQVKTDNFLLPLRDNGVADSRQDETRQRLLTVRLQRAIGTTYDPEDELNKHYSYASLPRQFDELIWFDETQAVKPLAQATVKHPKLYEDDIENLAVNNLCSAVCHFFRYGVLHGNMNHCIVKPIISPIVFHSKI